MWKPLSSLIALQCRYGWEPQLAELTWHALFLVPLLSMDPLFGLTESQSAYAIPTLVIWAIRFFILKIMLGAGLIKIKSSDNKWKFPELSAMDYFYETQASSRSGFYFECFETQVSSLHSSHAPTLSLASFIACREAGTDSKFSQTTSSSWWLHSY